MSWIFASLIAMSAALGAATPVLGADAAVATTPVKPLYTTADTPLGDLLDDPAAKAVLLKYIPDIIKNDGIEMARGMTLKTLQSYAGDQLTDDKLALIDAEFAKLAGK